MDYKKIITRAIELSGFCPASEKAFSVGAIIFDKSGKEIATGYSRETDLVSHAEEVAISKAKTAGADIRGGAIVCSMEPCGERLSKQKSCAELIIEAGLASVIYAQAEPPKFINAPKGSVKLIAGGVQVLFVS